MRAKSSLAAVGLAATLYAFGVGFAGLSLAAPPQGASLAPQAIDSKVLARVIPGISKDRVKSLLGDPWRTVQYNDLEEVENEFWEYRGKDVHGTYRVHIEFDKQGVVVVVAKVPDKASTKGTPAKS